MQLFGTEPQRRHWIRDGSAIGEARRDAQHLAAKLGLAQTPAGRVGLVVTELATNLLRHAQGGELLLQSVPAPGGPAIEVIALDRGPGMADTVRCLRDGYSSAGTAGTGLGAVKRLSADFDMYSVVGRGTAVMARVGEAHSCRFGAVCTAVEGETECGDAWRLAQRDRETALVVIDGLGHGSQAAAASARAADVFGQAPFDAPRLLIERMHQALNGTRGAAAACALVNERQALVYAGIGNIYGHLLNAGKSRGLVSHSGTLGFQAQRVQQFDYSSEGSIMLIMHSDGLSGRWDLDDHPGLRQRHPAVIAAVLYREHGRVRDDATVVVIGS
jgi:anti-sigma regulatory factor (Ser/Thr protein kinase)